MLSENEIRDKTNNGKHSSHTVNLASKISIKATLPDVFVSTNSTKDYKMKFSEEEVLYSKETLQNKIKR